MEIGTAVANAFRLAQTRYPELHEEWIRISFRVGGRLPKSLLSASIQRDGTVDLLLRCMEDEQARATATNTKTGMFNFHYQKMLSDYWIGGIYESFGTLRRRKLADAAAAFEQIFSDLESIWVPLEKHELPKDWSLKAPLTMGRNPRNNNSTDLYVYDPKDNKRAHIMGAAITRNGSVIWHVIDLKTENDRWVERRDLSDRILALWKGV
jgi:hypothetical protein